EYKQTKSVLARTTARIRAVTTQVSLGAKRKEKLLPNKNRRIVSIAIGKVSRRSLLTARQRNAIFFCYPSHPLISRSAFIHIQFVNYLPDSFAFPNRL